MRYLSLYPEEPRTPIETCERFDYSDPDCKRCGLCAHARNVCVGDEIVGDGSGEVVLLVGESPGQQEDRANRPFFGPSGAILRDLVKRHWKRGSYVLSNAIRCAPTRRESGDDKFKETEIAACRNYLAGTIAAVKPARIICLGQWAARSVVGRNVAPLSTRKGYSYLYGFDTEDPIPVFFVMHPAAALRNKFLNRWFEEDLAWALTCPDPEEPPVNALIGVVETREDAEEALRIIEDEDWTTEDIEAAGVPHESNYRLLSVAVGLPSIPNNVAAFVWMGDGTSTPAGGLKAGAEVLRNYAVDGSLTKYLQNGKYDEVGLRLTLGVWTKGIRGDIRIDRKLIEPHASGYLEAMADLVGTGGYKDPIEVDVIARCRPIRTAVNAEETARKRAKLGKTYSPSEKTRAAMEVLRTLRERDPELAALAARFTGEKRESRRWGYAIVAKENPNELIRANAGDVVTTARVKRWTSARLAADADLLALKAAFVDRVGPSLARVECWGVPVSRAGIYAFDHYLEPQLAPLQEWATQEKVDPQSPKQVLAYLKRIGVKSPKKTKKGNLSTDKEALELLEATSPEVRKITEYRHIMHMRSTYGAGMLGCIADDERIHPTLLPDGAETGRMSCREPNLQNIPRASDSIEGKMIRDAFIAQPMHSLLSLDYSQLELRVAAMLSQDERMLEIYSEGADVDFHQRTAEMIAQMVWNIRPEEVKSFHRTAAKTVVFSSLYGAGDEKIAAQIRKVLTAKWKPGDPPIPNITAKDVAKIKTFIFGKYVKLDEFMKWTVKQAHKTGFMRTWWNGRWARRRAMWQVADHDDGRRGHAERSVANGYVQGCLPASTRVLTSNGMLPIGSIPAQGRVWTGTNWAPYSRLNRGPCRLAEIEFSNGAVLRCDTRHKMLVATEEDYHFADFEDLKPGVRVCYSPAQPVEFASCSTNLSHDDTYWMGFAIGNGYAARNGVTMAFGDRKMRYTKEAKAAEWCTYAEQIGFKARCDFVPEGKNKLTYTVEHKEFRARWESFGYCWSSRAHTKRVPSSIWTSSLAHRRAFLLGFLDADGCVMTGRTTGQATLHSPNRELLAETQILLRTCGVESKLRMLKTGNARLEMNRGQLRRHFDYGCATTIVVQMPAPRFVLNAFLAATLIPGTDRESHRVIYKRLQAGGTTSIYTLIEMLQAYDKPVQMQIPLYALHDVVAVRVLDKEEETYTLSVDSPLHRFDSEGVISKNTAGDYCTASLVAMVEWLLSENIEHDCQLILAVHDQLLFHVRDELIHRVAAKAEEVMTSWPTMGGMKLVADKEVGKSWGSMTKWKKWIAEKSS